jgi:hypothetical protein
MFSKLPWICCLHACYTDSLLQSYFVRMRAPKKAQERAFAVRLYALTETNPSSVPEQQLKELKDDFDAR